MAEIGELKVVDALTLPDSLRALVRPGESMQDQAGRTHVLPRFFYQVDSWNQAKETLLAEHFTLAEMLVVDYREAGQLRNEFPHYVPCAVTVIGFYLEAFRQKAGAPVHIAANGGYRSPAHRLSQAADCHVWGCAADIYRVGDFWLDNQGDIEKFGKLAASAGLRVESYGHGDGETDDHLHVDLGYVSSVPRECDEAR